MPPGRHWACLEVIVDGDEKELRLHLRTFLMQVLEQVLVLEHLDNDICSKAISIVMKE